MYLFATVTAGAALFGGGATVIYDPKSDFFKNHASKGKTLHKAVYQNYQEKIKDSQELEQHFRDKTKDITKEMQELEENKEEWLRQIREAASEITLKAGQIEDSNNDLLKQQNETEKRQLMYAISEDIIGKKAMPCKYMAKATEEEAQKYAGLYTIEDWKPKADLISEKMILLENTGFPYSPSCGQKTWSLFRGRGTNGSRQLSDEFKVYCQGIVGFKTALPLSSSSDIDVLFEQTRDRLYKDACDPSLSKSKRRRAKRKMDALMEVYNDDDDDDEADDEADEETSSAAKRQKTTGEKDIAGPKTTGEAAINE
jgi:hypothetical protein